MDNKLQKDEFYLKGDLGTIKEAHSGNVANIDKAVYNKVSGCVTLTVTPLPEKIIINCTDPDGNVDSSGEWTNGYKDFKQLWQPTEDADFEIIQHKKLNNG